MNSGIHEAMRPFDWKPRSDSPQPCWKIGTSAP